MDFCWQNMDVAVTDLHGVAIELGQHQLAVLERRGTIFGQQTWRCLETPQLVNHGWSVYYSESSIIIIYFLHFLLNWLHHGVHPSFSETHPDVGMIPRSLPLGRDSGDGNVDISTKPEKIDEPHGSFCFPSTPTPATEFCCQATPSNTGHAV